MTGPATPPPSFRIVTSPDDAPEAFIPMNPTVRSRAVLQRLLAGPTEQEREESRRWSADREALRVAEMTAHLSLHQELLALHEATPIVSDLLRSHHPVAEVWTKAVFQKCHGCAPHWDSSSETAYPSWPCPTWTTIAEQTERKR